MLRILYSVGVRGFHSRVILSLGAMGLGSGHLEIFVFRLLNKKTDSGIIGLVRPAGGHKISLKLINYYVKRTNRFF